MAYRLKKNESVPEGLKRIVVEEIDSAIGELSTTRNRDEAIHEARKSLKKVRGVVRLVQPELGRLYRSENEHLAGIGRTLSELRDATAVIEVFDSLMEKFKEALRKDALGSIRRGLQNAKRGTERALNADKAVEQTLRTLRATRKRVKNWPLKLDGFSAVEPGLKERYRRGRGAMTFARKQQTPESFHEWRKRVKDHWYHVRLLESAWTDLLEAREGSLKNLETWLGDDHNLVVLCDTIQKDPASFGEPTDIQLFMALSHQYQRELRENALSLGERLYEEKPGAFVQGLRKLWDAWHAEPESYANTQPGESDAAAKKQAGRESDKAKKRAAA